MTYVVLLLLALFTENFVTERVFGFGFFATVKFRKRFLTYGLLLTTLPLTAAVAAAGALERFVALPFDGLRYVLAPAVCAAVTWLLCRYIIRLRPDNEEEISAMMPSVLVNGSAAALLVLAHDATLSYVASVVYAAFAGVGILGAWWLVSLVLDRVKYADVPRSFRGLPVMLVTAALLALLLTAFSGLGL